jgi:hypothetical protein
MNELPLGTTGKFQKANLLASLQGRFYKLGWFRFASDGGLYAQFHYDAPVHCMGEAVQATGLLQPRTCEDLTHRSASERTNVHFSLHPSGVVHVRSGEDRPLVERDFGQWLPPKVPCLLGYLFSPAVGDLESKATKKFQDRAFRIDCPESGIRATITLLPKGYRPTQLALMGVSPKYNVCVTVAAVNPATPGIYFVTDLGTPADRNA